MGSEGVAGASTLPKSELYMRHCRAFTIWIPLVFCGCGSHQSPSLNGIVLTNRETGKSLLLSARCYASEGDAPVSGASIRLFVDPQLTEEATKNAIVSYVSGKYEIEVKALPPSKDSHGYYYLVVEKAGFTTLTYPVSIGRRSPYLEHTVYLWKQN
jgi:hypothetical protein